MLTPVMQEYIHERLWMQDKAASKNSLACIYTGADISYVQDDEVILHTSDSEKRDERAVALMLAPEPARRDSRSATC
jgi:hypothetical protein